MSASEPPPARRWHPLALSAWCVAAAFGTYFCMYGFRKPWTAAGFEGVTLAGVGYKAVLVAAQTLGYMLSKFAGIKVISEMPPRRRAAGVLALVAAAQLALLAFAVVPPPYNALCLFANGLPLGLVFGLVVGYLEGRRVTEALTAGLCASFILAGGVTKSVGASLLADGVSEWWMPFRAGLVFAVPLFGFVWMLTRVPPPDGRDVAARSERVPITAAERRAFFGRHAAGLTLLVAVYLLVSVVRGVRDDFAPEIFRSLGWDGAPAVFVRTDLYVALGVLAVTGAGFVVRDNRRAFLLAAAAAAAGFGLLAVALVGLAGGWLGGVAFMAVAGLGLYVPYVLFHTTLFERLIAMTRDRGNLGYLMSVADSVGYLGYAAVVIVRELVGVRGGVLPFFVGACWVTAAAGVLGLAGAAWYFGRRPGGQ